MPTEKTVATQIAEFMHAQDLENLTPDQLRGLVDREFPNATMDQRREGAGLAAAIMRQDGAEATAEADALERFAAQRHRRHLIARMAATFWVVHRASGGPDPDADEIGHMLAEMTTPETIEEFLAQARLTLGQAAHMITGRR
ncbi:MAG: hypothetical protein WDM85_07800 [Caulobacteraceae bacterium]